MTAYFSVWKSRTCFDFPEKKASVEQLKKQRILFNNSLSQFPPKGYPRIFLDQRLKTRFNQSTI